MIGASETKTKVMLIDDEADIISVMKRGLEQHGFQVDVFINPIAALGHFKANYYDIVLTDVRMHGMTGFELARQIWALDNKARICFLSSFDISENEAKKVFTKFKTHCFIKKPLTPSQLANHIKEHAMNR